MAVTLAKTFSVTHTVFGNNKECVAADPVEHFGLGAAIRKATEALNCPQISYVTKAATRPAEWREAKNVDMQLELTYVPDKDETTTADEQKQQLARFMDIVGDAYFDTVL